MKEMQGGDHSLPLFNLTWQSWKDQRRLLTVLGGQELGLAVLLFRPAVLPLIVTKLELHILLPGSLNHCCFKLAGPF